MANQTINKSPTILNMVSNFTKTMIQFVKSGLAIVGENEFQRRLTICRGCNLWDEAGRHGLGKCFHKKCGCTKIKHWLETSDCPIKKWDTGRVS